MENHTISMHEATIKKAHEATVKQAREDQYWWNKIATLFNTTLVSFTYKQSAVFANGISIDDSRVARRLQELLELREKHKLMKLDLEDKNDELNQSRDQLSSGELN